MRITKSKNYYRFADNISNNNVLSLMRIIKKENKEDIFYYRLINKMLKSSTKSLDKIDFEVKKTEYYDTVLNNIQSDLYNYVIIEQKMQYINEKFTPSVTFDNVIDLFNDYIENNRLIQQELEIELASIKVNYDLLLNNHTRYAKRLAMDAVYGHNENYLTLEAEEKLLEKITLSDLQDCVSNTECVHEYVFHKTNANEEYQKKLISEQLEIQKYQECLEFSEIVVEKNIDQAKLNLMYVFSKEYTREALNVFNMILGADSFSKLFVNVREAHSICYYVNSRVVNRKLIQIETGINKANIDQAERLIDEQISAIKNNEISEIELAKAKIVNTYQGMENEYLMRKSLTENNILYGLSDDIGEIINDVMAVTNEEIVEMAMDLKKIKKVVVK